LIARKTIHFWARTKMEVLLDGLHTTCTKL
jgi:hypothetical protein